MKTLRVWAALMFMAVMVWYSMEDRSKSSKPKAVNYSSFMVMVKNDEVARVSIEGIDLFGQTKSDVFFQTILPYRFDSLNDLLVSKSIETTYRKPQTGGWLTMILGWVVPAVIFITFFVIVQKKMSGGSGGGGLLGFMGNKAKEISAEAVKTTFADVAGIDEAKAELQEVVAYLKDPKKYDRLGAKVSKGVMLVGPPGTGKTLLARAVAGEASVPFFQIGGSEFVEVFVGVGASRVRSLFMEATRRAPCIIFIDEIDAVGQHRGNRGSINTHSENDQTLNQLLASMDGFNNKTGVVVIAATNRPETLDDALLRPGRFDRHIIVPLPDVVGREAILRVHAKKVVLHKTVDLTIVARLTSNFSGADLANLLNEAAIFATRKEREAIMMDDVEEARDRIILGAARISMRINVDDKKRVAFHESGHALVAMASDGADPVTKITIIPRGLALGLTAQQSDEDRYIQSIEFLKIRLAVLMGGRVAEKLIFKNRSTGAANDLEVAVKLARNMVTRFGMSETFGPLSLPLPNKQFDADSPEVSEQTLQLIDAEVKELLKEAEQVARGILESHLRTLQTLAEKLLEKETINGDEARIIYEQCRPHDY